MPDFLETNFDGLVGPTHNYAGLSFGNVASLKNRGKVSNPRAAALQGLAKMKALVELGIPQGFLPPLQRPLWKVWHQLGYQGKKSEVLEKLGRQQPELLTAGWSASSMWVANAATFIPSSNLQSTHVIPANLNTTWHRSLEVADTARLLKWAFPAKAGFIHHSPLPCHPQFSDEGAANHTRLAPHSGMQGLHLFVHGSLDKASQSKNRTHRFPARQTLEASQAVARLAEMQPEDVIHLQQNPKAIQAGVFHNDVIAVGQGSYWLVHQDAYANGEADIKRVRQAYQKKFGVPLKVLLVQRKDLSLAEAVSTYLFNSQWLNLPNGESVLVCARECRMHSKAWSVVQQWRDAGNCNRVIVLDLRQSMRNGGGPACLRLRVDITDKQWRGIPGKLRLTPETINQIETWVMAYYRDRLTPKDLVDIDLANEVEAAFIALEKILSLGDLYSF